MPYCHVPAPLTVLLRLLTLFIAALLACAPAYASADYPELAAALRHRLAGKAAPTPALRALAHRLTAGRADPRMRALALSDWVRTHIRHADAHSRSDASPHPAATVLDSGYGDGLETALLLQALLAAAGIDATLALVQRGPDYGLPDPPTLAAFDDTIVYLPGFGLWLDPNEREMAAGYLPPTLLGKPVLLVVNGSLAMTPLTQPQSVRSAASVDIRRDGRASVRLERVYAGAAAEPARMAARAMARNAQPAARAQLASYLLQDVGQFGHGTLTSGSLEAGGDYSMTLSGIIPQLLALPGARQLRTAYAHLDTIDEAVAALPRARAPGSAGPVACAAVDAEDQIRLRLPPELHIVDVPASVNVVQGGLFYRADYERQGDAVLIKRRLTFRSGRPTCSAADVKALQTALARIERDLRSTITIAGP